MTPRLVDYVNWNEQEILHADEYYSILKDKAQELAVDEWQFESWLNENYSASEVWDMTDEQMEEVRAQWVSYCEGEADDELGYKRIEIG